MAGSENNKSKPPRALYEEYALGQQQLLAKQVRDILNDDGRTPEQKVVDARKWVQQVIDTK